MADSVEQNKLSLDRKKRMFRMWEDNKRDSGEIDEQRLHRKYYHGKQWTDDELRVLRERKQPALTSNRIKRKVDFLVGMEQRQRTDPKAYPRTPIHQEAAELATQSIRYVCDNNDWPSRASDTAHNGLVSGIGGVSVLVENDEVTIDLLRADEIFIDPRSVRWDTEDARYKGIYKWVDIEEAQEDFPHIKLPDLERSAGGDELETIIDDDKDKNWSDFEKRRIRLVEMYYKYKGEWRVCHFTGFQELSDEPSFYLDEQGRPECPYRIWSPYVDEEGIRYGVVRDMKSSQDEINQRRSKLLYFMSVRQTHGEKGAVDNVAQMKRETARPDGHIETNPGLEFGFVDNTFQAQGQAELLQEAKAEIENLGPNPGLVGRGVEKQSGRAILAQQNSGMTELSPVFERLRGWKLSVYTALWLRIQQTWRAPRWLRVTDDEDALQFIGVNRLVRDEFGNIGVENQIAELDVDIILDEGPDTLTIQQEEFEQLANMVSSGLPIPADIILEVSSLGGARKKQILDRMRGGGEQSPQEQALQEKQLELEIRGSEAEVQKTEAEAADKAASAQQKQVQTQREAFELGVAVG